MIEEFTVGSDVERAEQDIGEIERAKVAVELAHVAEDKRGFNAETPRLVTAELDHGAAQIETAIGVAPLVPLFEIRGGAGPELENSLDPRLRKFADYGFEKVDLTGGVVRRQRNFVVMRIIIRLHRAIQAA